MKSARWWWGMLQGCPDDLSSNPEAFEDKGSAERLLDRMTYTLAKQNELTDDADEARMEAKWASARIYSHCVLKHRYKHGDWVGRLLRIENGTISWQTTRACQSNFLDSVLHAMSGAERKITMQFLTAPEGEAPVRFGDAEMSGHAPQENGCILFQNPYRKFAFC